MIESIQLSSVATYGSEPQRLTGLRQFNFVYGSNGSGKTTISRAIANIQAPAHAACGLGWKGGLPMETLVYNRDFVEENFALDEIKGVFTVGQQSVEAAQEIAKLRVDVAAEAEKIASLRQTLRGPDSAVEGGKRAELAALEEKLTETCWSQKTKHEKRLSHALEGYRGSRSKFKQKVVETLGAAIPADHEAASLDEMHVRALTVYGPSKDPEPLLTVPSAQALIDLEADPILAKIVVGKKDVDIAALIEKLGISDWVKQGQPYLALAAGPCPFCQQPAPATLADSLSHYFDEVFVADVDAIGSLAFRYGRTGDAWLAAVQQVIDSKSPRVDLDSLRTLRDVAEARIAANLILIQAKRSQPSRPIELDSIEEMAAAAVEPISSANVAIREHNATVADLSNQRAKLTRQVWRHIVDVDLAADLASHKGAAKGLEKAIESLSAQIKGAEDRRKASEDKIKALEKTTTSVQPTVDDINRMLAAYGFGGFTIARAEGGNKYRLRRADGANARATLSEGERTFITFLYFYHLLHGSAAETGTQAERIAVFDDPVSSLDSDVLFIVSSLLHRLMDAVRDGKGTVKQIFVLTHNVHFHKEVCFNPKRSTQALNEETFWVVRKASERSVIEAHASNPVSSSYEMLWADLRREGPKPPSIQNTLRRILETYFKILGGLDLGLIWQSFEPADQPICKSLFSWVNAGSHGALDDLHFAIDEAGVDRHVRVFKEVFRKSNHLPHYQMMMREQDDGTPPMH